MIPDFHIANVHFSAYGLMAALGIIAVIFTCDALGRQRGHAPFEFLNSVLFMAVGCFLGAHILFGITNLGNIVDALGRPDQYGAPGEVIAMLLQEFGGMVFYGGFFGALAGLVVWLKWTGRKWDDYLDMFAVGVPLFHVFGRIGCFLAGCCFGVECDIGFVYHYSPSEMANGVTRFPVQLLEASCEALLFIVLLRLYLKRRLHGQLIWMWMGSYSVIRFLDEFLRGDAYRGFLGPFSTSQWISLIVFAVVLLHVFTTSRKSRERAADA